MPDEAIGITIQAGTLVLADGTATGGLCVDDITLSGTRALDIVALARAAAVEVFDRGNARNRVEFTVDRTFTDLLSARQAQFAILDVISGTTDLVMLFNDGVNTLSVTLPDAGWTPISPRFEGISMVTKFTVEGGKFAITTTGAPFDFLAGGGTSDYATATIPTTGTTTITPAAGVSFLTEVITVTDPGSGYTNKIVLDVTGRTKGDRILIQIAMPNSGNPVIEIHNATTGGTLLDTVATDAIKARIYDYCFVYSGSTWVLFAVREELS